MKFDIMRYFVARTIAKNEGASNPNRVAMLPAMLEASMPVTLLMTQAMARREVASQPAASIPKTKEVRWPMESTPQPPDAAFSEDILIGESSEFAKGYCTPWGFDCTAIVGDTCEDKYNTGSVIDVSGPDKDDKIVLTTNPPPKSGERNK